VGENFAGNEQCARPNPHHGIRRLSTGGRPDRSLSARADQVDPRLEPTGWSGALGPPKKIPPLSPLSPPVNSASRPELPSLRSHSQSVSRCRIVGSVTHRTRSALLPVR